MRRSILRAFLITLYPPIQSMPTPAVVTEENEIEGEIVYDDFQGETEEDVAFDYVVDPTIDQDGWILEISSVDDHFLRTNLLKDNEQHIILQRNYETVYYTFIHL